MAKIKVKDLIEMLKKLDPDAAIGAGELNLHGFAQEFTGEVYQSNNTYVLNLDDYRMFDGDDVEFQKVLV